MIGNARMYAVTASVGEKWRRLLQEIAARARVHLDWEEHAEPSPISELWRRPDLGAVFMCGLPFIRARPPPALVAAPVPSPAAFQGRPCYWSELIVRHDSDFGDLSDTFGGRIALTTPDSQSGCLAALYYLMDARARASGAHPLYSEVIAPRITPLGAVAAVIDGLADVAPVDSFAFRLLEKYRPDLTSQVRSVARTLPTPIPPLISSRATPPSLESEFLKAHNEASLKALMEDLQLDRFVRVDAASYDVLQQRFEAASGFWREHPFASVVHPAFAGLIGQPRSVP
jgi:ABC-type phosphate/phosphonate transport system substrate-binding protein